MRTRTPRVRRDPIDVQLIEAELAESMEEPEPGSLGADEILAALEAEVGRAAVQRAAADPAPPRPAPAPRFDAAPPPPAPAPRAPAPRPRLETPRPLVEAPRPAAPQRAAAVCGVEADQVRAWMDQVQEDLRQVRARVQFLRLEQARLVDQQRLVAELITSSNPA